MREQQTNKYLHKTVILDKVLESITYIQLLWKCLISLSFGRGSVTIAGDVS